MSWVRIDDRVLTDDKIAQLSGNAFKVWIFSLCFSNQNLTDGFINSRILPLLSGRKKQVQELVEAGLWRETSDGWEIVNFLKFQPSRLEVEEKRAKNREKLERWRNQ